MKPDPHTAPDSDPWSRHAPAGFKIAMQYFCGETRDQALADAARFLSSVRRKVRPEDLRIAPGHFSEGAEGEHEGDPIFRPFGWMVFEPEDW